jgi:hypothetical protein
MLGGLQIPPRAGQQEFGEGGGDLGQPVDGGAALAEMPGRGGGTTLARHHDGHRALAEDVGFVECQGQGHGVARAGQQRIGLAQGLAGALRHFQLLGCATGVQHVAGQVGVGVGLLGEHRAAPAPLAPQGFEQHGQLLEGQVQQGRFVVVVGAQVRAHAHPGVQVQQGVDHRVVAVEIAFRLPRVAQAHQVMHLRHQGRPLGRVGGAPLFGGDALQGFVQQPVHPLLLPDQFGAGAFLARQDAGRQAAVHRQRHRQIPQVAAAQQGRFPRLGVVHPLVVARGDKAHQGGQRPCQHHADDHELRAEAQVVEQVLGGLEPAAGARRQGRQQRHGRSLELAHPMVAARGPAVQPG